MKIKRLNSNAGVGFPIRLDHLNAMQNSLITAIARLCTDALCAFGDDNHGMLITGSISITGYNRDLATTDCLIAWQGKLYYLPETTMSGNYGPYTNYALVPTTATELPLLFKDGNTHNTLIYDTLSVVMYNGYTDPQPDNSLEIDYVIRFSSLYVKNTPKSWTVAVMLNDWVSITGDPLRYRLNLIGQLELRGSIRLTTGGNQTLPITNLPTGYRPSSNRYLLIAAKQDANSPTESPVMLILSPDGNLGGLSPYDTVSGIYRFSHVIPL
jgi:hypothetical protein